MKKEVYAIAIEEDGTKRFVKTKIDDYESIEMGRKNKKISFLIFRDNINKTWFCAVERYGMIVHINKNKTKLLSNVKNFLKNRDYDDLCEKLKKRKDNCKKADLEDKELFFERFSY